ncbi:sigma-70 family RNA polymerase sigma factor [Streptomyces sp. YC504]|uniref:Sigma-70 family RNA polymerase sigma factor n=1 Tax=Streptomyces mesophilus TaxID=1775132 RepID=A0A6G4XWX0_9ACTN|nr:sigma-70 family RNA polymerase sigma factor [Streptomyces mesophilus]NGO81307.1 sigma-70 family RNA polymerase sigma factor [Streptomyces mesophilus]
MGERETATATATAALGELYASYGPQLTKRARKKLDEYGIPPSVTAPEDLVHSAFAQVLRNPEAITYPKTYLTRVVENEAAKIARQRSHLMEAETEHARIAGETDADVAALVANRCALRQFLGELPPSQRDAVWSSKALGYTLAETAELLHKAPGTVAVQVSRATRFLRANLAAVYVALLVALAVLVGGGLRRVQPASPSGEQEPPTGWEDTLLYQFVESASGTGVAWVGAGLVCAEVIRRGWIARLVDPSTYRRIKFVLASQRYRWSLFLARIAPVAAAQPPRFSSVTPLDVEMARTYNRSLQEPSRTHVRNDGKVVGIRTFSGGPVAPHPAHWRVTAPRVARSSANIEAQELEPLRNHLDELVETEPATPPRSPLKWAELFAGTLVAHEEVQPRAAVEPQQLKFAGLEEAPALARLFSSHGHMSKTWWDQAFTVMDTVRNAPQGVPREQILDRLYGVDQDVDRLLGVLLKKNFLRLTDGRFVRGNALAELDRVPEPFGPAPAVTAVAGVATATGTAA